MAETKIEADPTEIIARQQAQIDALLGIVNKQTVEPPPSPEDMKKFRKVAQGKGLRAKKLEDAELAELLDDISMGEPTHVLALRREIAALESKNALARIPKDELKEALARCRLPALHETNTVNQHILYLEKQIA